MSAQTRYRLTHTGDIVELQDTRTQLVVKVVTTAGNAYQMTRAAALVMLGANERRRHTRSRY